MAPNLSAIAQGEATICMLWCMTMCLLLAARLATHRAVPLHPLPCPTTPPIPATRLWF